METPLNISKDSPIGNATESQFRADLHCHTTCSDGSLNPEAIIHLAKSQNLSGLSITDHDSVSSYSVAIPLAKKLGLELIVGAEFSSVHKEVSVHILAYSFPVDSPLIHHFCHTHLERRHDRNLAILDQLKKHNMPVSESDMLESVDNNFPCEKHTVGRPHIALAMLRKGYVNSVKDAFQHYIGEGKLCYVPGAYYTTQETIDIIHKAGGVAIIAHPHLIEERSIVKELLSMNFDGLEGYYGTFNADQNEKWIKLAKERNWLITGGSDFHGSIKPYVPLGCAWVDKETFMRLKNVNKRE